MFNFLRKFWQWLKEPRKATGEQWAVENGHYKAYMGGYTQRGENPFPKKCGDFLAFELGKSDAEFDLDRQW